MPFAFRNKLLCCPLLFAAFAAHMLLVFQNLLPAAAVEKARMEELLQLKEKQQPPGMTVVVVGNTGAGKVCVLLQAIANCGGW